MSYTVNFKEVETHLLDKSPVKEVLAGLRANEARYFWNKYQLTYEVFTPEEKPEILPFIEEVLSERDMVFPYQALCLSQFEVDGILWSHVYYDNGLAVNVLYTLEEGGKRAVGFKLSNGIEIPKEFEGKFKFARQRSKLAGEIRGTFFVIKGEYL
ncbi:phage tail protein [Streptococcus iniae]|uniref:phage tail protein n=1 Tax=Streptococcus iniae TaxID=1346 RepID=UPI000EF6FE54|nr:phage tail protein [Streptococcus iniae]RLV42511.1 phage tail protein [Streptococcus iniae]